MRSATFASTSTSTSTSPSIGLAKLSVIALALQALLSLALIWSFAWLPLGDLGGHIELMDIAQRGHDPATLYPQCYRVGSLWTANALALLVSRIVSPWLGTVLVAKLLLSLYVLGVPASLAYLARTFNRSLTLVFFATPLVFGAIFNVGFLNYMLGLPCVFLAVALAHRFVTTDTNAAGIALSGVLTVCFLAHILTYLAALGLVSCVLVVWVSRKQIVRAGLFILLSTPLFMQWIYQRMVLNQANIGEQRLLTDQGTLGAVYASFSERIAHLYDWSFQFARSSVDEWYCAALGLIWFVLLFASPTAQPPAAKVRLRSWLQDHTLWLLAALGALAYFVLPTHVKEAQNISDRMAYFMWAPLMLWPRNLGAKVSRACLICIMALSLVYTSYVYNVCRRFDREVQALPNMIASLPARSVLGYMRWDGDHTLVHMGPLWHIPKALHSTLNGGVTDDTFAIRPYYGIAIRPACVTGSMSPDFWQSSNLQRFDHVLLLSTPKPVKALQQVNLQLVRHAGAWWLFRVKR